jgi:hypothetical protein
MPGGQKTTGTQQLLTLLASRWTIPVIYALQHDTLRYSAIEKALPNITQRVLTTCKCDYYMGQTHSVITFTGRVQKHIKICTLKARKPMSRPSHDTQAYPPVQLPPQLCDLWETEMVPQLPAKLDEQARALKAYQRYREIGRASDLLRALLAWVLGGCSFRQLGSWAVILGVADVSEAAWRKRVRLCGDWLQWLLTEVMAPARGAAQFNPQPDQPRVILVDGTSLGQAGGTGDDWRVQLAYDLVQGRLVHVQIGDRHQAETLVGLPGRAGDLFVGDRGYGIRTNLFALEGMQAAALLRFSPNHCRLQQADGTPLAVSQWLQAQGEQVQICEREGYGVEGSERVKVRVLALRLPSQEAEKARERVRARAKRKQQAVRPETLQLAGWVLLLSTLEAELWPAEELFWLYRNRWQIELLIKQMKQFLLLVRLRSSHLETVRATLLAALVAWVLQEKEGQALLHSLVTTPERSQQSLLQAYGSLVEQWDVEETTKEETERDLRCPVSRWGLMATCLSRWRAVVLGQWSFAHLQACLPRLRRFFCLSPRRRKHQWLGFQAWVHQRFLGTQWQGLFP